MRMMKNDEGAASLLVALVVAALMLPTIALAVDVGGMYAERRRLQNSADAGAMAVALSCAKGSCVTGNASTYGVQNDYKGMDVKSVCGNFPGLTACAPDPSCFPRTPTNQYVQVVVSTKGGTWTPVILPKSKKNIPACARATVTGVSGGKTIPVTLSVCEWQAATSGGYVSYPPNPPVSAERVIQLHGATVASCPGQGPSGADAPGGFGWLQTASGCQTASIKTGDLVSTDPGNSLPSSCASDYLNSIAAAHNVVYVPVFDQITGTGSGIQYHLKGFAAFVLTGYYGVSTAKPKSLNSWLSGKALCKSSDVCLYGFFTQALVPAKDMTGGGSDMGARLVSMVL